MPALIFAKQQPRTAELLGLDPIAPGMLANATGGEPQPCYPFLLFPSYC